MISPFGHILQSAVEATPGALGGALAAGDGETVDSFWLPDTNHDGAFLIAHFGIIVRHIRHALHTFHFGDVQFVHVCFDELDVSIQMVMGEYYMLLAIRPPVQIALVGRQLADTAQDLHREMV